MQCNAWKAPGLSLRFEVVVSSRWLVLPSFQNNKAQQSSRPGLATFDNPARGYLHMCLYLLYTYVQACDAFQFLISLFPFQF